MTVLFLLVIQYLPHSFGRTIQHESPDEEDKEDDIWEGGREVDYLATRLNPLAQACEDDDPGE